MTIQRVALFLIALIPCSLAGQRVQIKNATPALVTQAAVDYLRPDGFVLVKGDSSEAVLVLNRGKIPQQGLYGGRRGDNLFWVMMEVHVQFKPKAGALEVSAFEDVVVLHDDSSLVQRRRVNSRGELDNLRQFVIELGRDVERRLAAASSAKPEE